MPSISNHAKLEWSLIVHKSNRDYGGTAMKVWFSQVYIEAGVEFAFSHHFQQFLSSQVSVLVKPSDLYAASFGLHFELMFRISAKTNTTNTEIMGPTVFRKTNDIEYTIFLPYDVISKQTCIARSALEYLFGGMYAVFKTLGIGTTEVLMNQKSLIDTICSDPLMFDRGPLELFQPTGL
jgi:hypothetical protein